MSEDEFNAMMPDGWIVVENDWGGYRACHWEVEGMILARSLGDMLRMARNHAWLQSALMREKRRFADDPIGWKLELERCQGGPPPGWAADGTE